jgi:hypothetical protein
VLNEKVRLLFAATAVEAEIQVELDRVDTCESIREMARFVKNSPCIVVVGVWTVIRITFAPRPTACTFS